MKFHSYSLRALTLFLGCTAALVQATSAGPSPAPAAKKDAEPAKAVFVLPHNPSEGRDPFFPRSLRPYSNNQPAIQTNAAPVIIAADLKLNGVSGTPAHRLAIINNYTFETGEEAEVNASNGKVKVRCIEIRPDSVIVFEGGQRRELRMRNVF